MYFYFYQVPQRDRVNLLWGLNDKDSPQNDYDNPNNTIPTTLTPRGTS